MLHALFADFGLDDAVVVVMGDRMDQAGLLAGIAPDTYIRIVKMLLGQLHVHGILAPRPPFVLSNCGHCTELYSFRKTHCSISPSEEPQCRSPKCHWRMRQRFGHISCHLAKRHNSKGLIVASPKKSRYQWAGARTDLDGVDDRDALVRSVPSSVLSAARAGRTKMKGRDHERRPSDHLPCKAW